ncbi:MAG: thioester reductase domain-containing protein [Bdellovibrionales bacterium]|nr:thioester reductase domain-containing protein [Bdellovibrionales bacterium]
MDTRKLYRRQLKFPGGPLEGQQILPVESAESDKLSTTRPGISFAGSIPAGFLERFEEVVKRFPDETAILWHGVPYFSFSELRERARGFASVLEAHGVNEEGIVALHLKKSPHFIVAVLGCWYARAAFLPLEPCWPKLRKERILSEARAKILVGESSDQLLGESANTEFLDCERAILTDTQVQQMNLERFDSYEYRPDRLAYVIYSSGSTGTPKGILVEHRGLTAVLYSQIEAIGLTVGWRSLWYLSLSFDASISDIGTALLSGATLCIEDGARLNPGVPLEQTILERGINYADLPPAVLPLLNIEKISPVLKTVLIGGEVCAPESVRQWAARTRLLNVYGPTETTICSSFSVCSREWERAMIGRPLPGFKYRIEGKDGGTDEGELLIGGVALARGYLQQQRLDRERFVFREGERYFRTGDKVRKSEDGSFEFLGRLDRQFKLYGRLIEPFEIEQILTQHTAVKRAAVLKDDFGKRCRLVCFIEFRSSRTSCSVPMLRKYLAMYLASWMIPERFIIRENLPTLTNGKIDFTALQREIESEESQENGSWSELQSTIIVEAWEKVLEVTEKERGQSFYDCGGDSLKAFELSAALSQFDISVEPLSLLEDPTLDQFLKALKSKAEISRGKSPTLLKTFAKLDEKTHQLLSSGSEREWKEDSSSHCRNIFLTGSTGYLGAHVLQELLTRENVRLNLLVRADSEDIAEKKILNALVVSGIEDLRVDWKKIRIVLGDITKERMGISEASWSQLAQECTEVFHLAAQVNDFLPLDDLSATNIEGMKTVLSFCLEGTRKWLHYASTISVFTRQQNSPHLLRESTLDLNGGAVVSGYAQSKWIAEYLLERAAEHGFMDFSIYRFGLLTPDPKKGIFPKNSLLEAVLDTLSVLRAYPRSVLIDKRTDITPVPLAAKIYVALTEQQHEERKRYFHVCGKSPVSLGDIAQNFVDLGIPIETVGMQEWKRRCSEKFTSYSKRIALHSLESGIENDPYTLFEAAHFEFDRTNTEKALRKLQMNVYWEPKGILRAYIQQRGHRRFCASDIDSWAGDEIQTREREIMKVVVQK